METIELLVFRISALSLLHLDPERRRRNAVCDHKYLALAWLRACWDIELGGDFFVSGCDAHRAVVVGAAIEDVSGGGVRCVGAEVIRGVFVLCACGGAVRMPEGLN